MDQRKSVRALVRRLKVLLQDERHSADLSSPGASVSVIASVPGFEQESARPFMGLVVDLLGLASVSQGCRAHLLENARIAFATNMPTETVLAYLAGDARLAGWNADLKAILAQPGLVDSLQLVGPTSRAKEVDLGASWVFSDNRARAQRGERELLREELKYFFLQCAGLRGIRIPEEQEGRMSMEDAHRAAFPSQEMFRPSREELRSQLDWMWNGWTLKFAAATTFVSWVKEYRECWKSPSAFSDVLSTLEALARYAKEE